jgi:hypothetical protein
MAEEFRVFVSAATSEFGAARDAVANDLQARGSGGVVVGLVPYTLLTFTIW